MRISLLFYGATTVVWPPSGLRVRIVTRGPAALVPAESRGSIHSASCGPSGSMEKNGKCGRHPKAETSRVAIRELLQGSVPGIHQVC